MLMMEVETDPLILQDPLDCASEAFNNEEPPGWVIQLKPEIVSEIVSKNFNGTPEIKKRAETLCAGKPSKIKDLDLENISELQWKIKVKKKRKKKITKRKIKVKENLEKKSSSDEENLVPAPDNNTKRNFKCKLKKENYQKKYKLMKEKRNYLCDMCKKTFITASHLKEHILSHCQCFPCEECGKVFNHLRSLQRHVAAGHGPNRSCKNYIFNEEEEHKKEPSTNLKTETSSAVDKSMRCKKYYDQLKSERKYQCEICQKTFITSGHLNTHMNCHSEKKWKCEGCGKSFSCERSLIRHRDTFPGDHWFPCQFCDMNFFRIINIVKHMETKHPEASIDANQVRELNLPEELKKIEASDGSEVGKVKNKLFICTQCLKVFYSSESLLVHKETVHCVTKLGKEEEEEGEEFNNLKDSSDQAFRYKCEVCSKEFISAEGFEYHKNNQHVEKEAKKKKKHRKRPAEGSPIRGGENDSQHSISSFVCKICTASFAVKSTLQTHLKTHNVTKNVEVKTGSHRCCICPRSFASSDGLKYHLATHTGERRYSCGQCGKKFIKKTHLSEHIATHSEIKYFKCLRCPRTFSTHSAYRKHIKHFPGPHSFPCTKCGKLFTKESMIEKHMCVDLVKVTMAPEVKALLSEDMIEEYLCLAEEQAAEELARKTWEPEKKIDEVDVKTETKNSSYSCYKCFKVFPNLSSLQSHQLEHIGKQNYQCRFCPENFKRADAFGAHIRNHLGSTPYMCLKCNRKFISPLTLSMHAKNYPGDHSFTCDKCQRWFPSEKRVERHECIFQNSDIFFCACGSTFKNWNELLQHAGTKPYKCCSCDLKYPTLIALARHIKKHTGVKPFSCEICGKSFRAKNNYLYHKNVHSDIKEINCDHCDFKSKSQKRMDFHLLRKHNIGSNTSSTLCSVCGIIFPYISQMKKHLEAEHGSESVVDKSKEDKKSLMVLCTFCGKLLNNKYTLANHMKKVHGPDNLAKDREINCEICGEKFRSAKKLQKHAEVHEAPGLRICEICNKDFYFAKDLRKHMKKHDNYKPYSCIRCGKNFKVSVSLKYHSSICGNPNKRLLSSRKKKEEKLPQNLYYGHIEPLDLNNRPYPVVYKK